MDFLTMTGSLMLLAAGIAIWRMKRILAERNREIGALKKTSEMYLDGRASARAERDRYIRLCAEKEAELREYKTLHDRSERLLAERTKALDEALKDRDAAYAAADQCEQDAERAMNAQKTAELEAERCRKECWMHEQERRKLEIGLQNLHDEYKKLLHKETDAEALLRDEMANFLSYDGSGKGQRELKVDDDG